jgi:zinc transporter ZupT
MMLQVAAPIYKSSHSATKAVWASLLSGLFEPLGALLAGLFLHQYLTDFRLNVLYCIGVPFTKSCSCSSDLSKLRSVL